MKNIKSSTFRDLLCQSIPQLIFCLTVFVSVLTTWYVTGHYLDSDASSEMVLAQHWIQTGEIFSQDWIYGSEYRILHQQLIFAPLMLFLEDWRLIRFIGTLIMQAIYILSYRFLCRQVGLSKRIFYLSAAVLLLPVSVTYGRIVLYHCHYLPNIALSFFIVGLSLGAPERFSFGNVRHLLRLGLLAACSFLGGLAGVRQLMITHAPLLLAIAVLALTEDIRQEQPGKASLFAQKNLNLLLWAAAGAVFSFCGLKVNSSVLNSFLISFLDPDGYLLAFAGGDDLGKILYGYFHQFGFREDVSIVSVLGLLSLGSLFAGVYLPVLAIGRLRRHQREDSDKIMVLCSFFLYYLGIMLVVFLITGGNQGYYHVLYLSLCIPWAIPLMVVDLEKRPAEVHPFHAKKLFAWAAAGILLLSGMANLTFFNGSKIFHQKYEGLGFYQPDKKEHLSGAAEYLLENGYTLGYATYWEANILTEITNGQLKAVNLYLNAENGSIGYFDCLTSLYLRETPAQRRFVLLSAKDRAYFEMSEDYPSCQLVYKDAYHLVYDVVDQECLRLTLYS